MEKEVIVDSIIQKEAHRETKSRYIPAGVKKILQKEHGTKCSIPHCTRLASVIHHTRRFGLSSSHDPRYLAPLCREHHQIAHLVDQKYTSFRSQPYFGNSS